MKCPTCDIGMIRIDPPGVRQAGGAMLCPECGGEWVPRPAGRPPPVAPDDPRRPEPPPPPRGAVHGRAAAGRREDVFNWF